MVKSNKIIIVDIETTNFLKRGGLIVEIGIVELDLETGNTKVLYDKIVKEGAMNETHQQAWIFSNSDLKFEDVMKSHPLQIEKLQNIFDKYYATAYNKKFDFDFLRSRGFKIKELPCPMIIATKICKIKSKGGYKWPKFQEAWDNVINKDYIEKHRGCDDAVHEAKFVYELYKNSKFPLPKELT